MGPLATQVAQVAPSSTLGNKPLFPSPWKKFAIFSHFDEYQDSISLGVNVALAQSHNIDGKGHELITHLTEVAGLTRQYARKFEASELGYWLGLWHDLGKFHPDFQAYLANPERRRGPDHKGAGWSERELAGFTGLVPPIYT